MALDQYSEFPNLMELFTAEYEELLDQLLCLDISTTTYKKYEYHQVAGYIELIKGHIHIEVGRIMFFKQIYKNGKIEYWRHTKPSMSLVQYILAKKQLDKIRKIYDVLSRCVTIIE